MSSSSACFYLQSLSRQCVSLYEKHYTWEQNTLKSKDWETTLDLVCYVLISSNEWLRKLIIIHCHRILFLWTDTKDPVKFRNSVESRNSITRSLNSLKLLVPFEYLLKMPASEYITISIFTSQRKGFHGHAWDPV